MKLLITGANSGFGLLTTRKFAEAGDTVFAGYRNPAKAASLRALADEGLPVRPVQLDVTRPDQVEAAVTDAGDLDVLVNNAGFEVRGPVDQLSDDLVQRQFDTNVLGVIRMIRAVTPGMRMRGSGTIVNVSSLAGQLTPPYAAIYAASKHAVEALSEAMWLELKPFGIRVVMVEPGAFATGFAENIVVEPNFNESSPHWPHAQRFNEALNAFMGAGRAQNDPQEVADIIFEAMNDPAPKLRYLAGQDARQLAPLYRSQEFEGFATGMLGALGLSDWGERGRA